MKWLKFAGGLAVLAAFGYAAWQVGGGGTNLPFLKPQPKSATLPAGSQVSLMLMRSLASGREQKGDRVPMVVAKDVTGPDGSVLIRAGAPAMAEVTWSRGSSAATQLINQPARLEIELVSVALADGQTVALTTKKGGKSTSYALTRQNTDSQDATDAVEALWKHQETQGALTALQQRLTGENPNSEIKAPDLQKALQDVARQMNMPNTQGAIQNPKAWDSLTSTIQKAQGGDFTGLTSGELGLALGAIGELGRLAGTVDKSLKGMIKGRNIVAPVGLPLTAYTAAPARVDLSKK